MKRTFLFWLGSVFNSLLIITFFISQAQARLVDLNDGTIADDRGTYSQCDDMYWIQDLNLFVGMTYDEQVTSISEIDYQGPYNMTDFHMAAESDILSLLDSSSLDEIAAVFTPTPHPTEPIPMWRARTTKFYADNAHYMYLIDLPPGEDYNGRFFPVWDDSPTFPGAWAVAYAGPCICTPWDIDGDGKRGLAESIQILRDLVGN